MPLGATQKGRRILVVEDDEGVRRSLRLMLEWKGFEVFPHAGMRSAIEAAKSTDIDLLVADYLLGDGDGVALLLELRASGWQGRAVLITSEPVSQLEARALAAGFHAVLAKPLVPNALIDSLTK